MATAEELNQVPVEEIVLQDVYLDEETHTFQYTDGAAMKLMLDDAEAADSYMNMNSWAAAWTLADSLYQSPAGQSVFDGGNVAQANVPKFVVSNHISAIIPRLMGGIFYEDPPFMLRPLPGTAQEVVRWKTAIFATQLSQMEFEEESERALDQMALLGTCIMKWGYSEYTEYQKKYIRKGQKITVQTAAGDFVEDTAESDDFDVTYDEKKVSRPWIKYCDVRTVLVDPGCRFGDIRRAKWVIYRDFATYEDIARLRGVEGYDIPDEATLKSFFLRPEAGAMTTGVDNLTLTLPEGMRGFIQHAVPRSYKTTADPLKNGIEVLERWDNDKVIVVLSVNNNNILIRNEPNPYGRIPFLSANWRNIPDCFYGQGLGQLIGGEQLVEQGITNLALDLLAYGLQPTAVRKKGFNVPTQNIKWKQGGIIDVDDDVEKAFKFLQMPDVPGEAWTFIQQSKSDSAATSGANEQVIQGAGSSGARSTGMRSGTGAAAVVQANASRLDGPDGRFIRQIFEPWLYIMDELNNDYMPTSALKQILGEKLSQEYIKTFNHVDYRNAKLEFAVLAGAHLGAKKEMAQALPIIMQLLANPTFSQNCKQAGKLFDAPAIFKAFTDAAGWKFSQDFLRDMTDEEKKFEQENSPAALQARALQAKQQADLQKFEEERKTVDAKQLGEAGNQVIRTSMEQQLKPEMLGTGQ